MNLRLTPRQADFLRTKALKNQMTLSQYVMTVVVRYYQLQAGLRNRQRRKKRVSMEEDGKWLED